MKLATLVITAVVALAGAGAAAQLVTFDFDRNADFSAYRTYAWAPGTPVPARSGTARAEQVLVGTLLVTMVDATTERLVWRSVATRDIDVDAKPDQRDKHIAKAAEKMFSHYPPEQEGR